MRPPVHQDPPNGERLVTVKIEESTLEAVIDAFESVGVDTMAREPLTEWIDCDAVEVLPSTTEAPFSFCTRIWEYPIVVTEDAVHVFGTPDE